MEKMVFFDKKALVYYFIVFCLLAITCFLFTFFGDKNYLLNASSVLGGFTIFSIINILTFYLMNRNKHNKLITPFFVLYEAVYATILKFSLLILLFGAIFKFFELNNKIVIFTFVVMVIFKILSYFTNNENGKDFK